MTCRKPGRASQPYACELLECRQLLSATVQYVSQGPGGTTTPVNFTADLASSGASVQQFTAAQRSLLEAGFANSEYDTYLRLDGVTGGATAVAHPGQIPILSFDWVQNGAATSGGTPPSTAIHFVADVSRASPQLMALLVTGTDIATGDLSVNTRGTSPSEFYHVHLENARVASYQLASANMLQEEFTLVFQKATITYAPGGAGEPPLQYVIDTAAQGATVSSFQPTQGSLLDAAVNPFSGSEFLRLDGISGDSTAVGHVGQIGVNSFGFTATSAGAASGRADYSSIHVLAPMSSASPRLMQAATTGQVIPTADLSVVSTGGFDTYDIHLTHVIVSSYRVQSGAGLDLTDEITLAFANIQVSYHVSSANQPLTVQFVDNAAVPTAESLPPPASLLDTFFPASTQSMYVRLDGVTGGTVVNGQPNELSALGFSWGDQGPAISNGSAGGHDHFQELHIVTPLSEASPQIESLAASGRVVPTADFIIVTSNASVPFYHVHLLNVVVTGDHLSTARDGQAEEEFTLGFTNVTVQVTTQAAPGMPGTTVTFQTDLTTQSDVLDGSAFEQQALLDQSFTPLGTGTELTIAGIPGDSINAEYPGAIDVLGFSTALNAPRDAATGQATGKLQFQPIHFVSALSSASPLLLNAMASGQVLATADLALSSALTGADRYTIHLENVRVVSDQIGTGPNGASDEEFSLAYSRVLVAYVAQDATGLQRSFQIVEDLQRNGDAIDGFTPPQQSLFAPPGPAVSPPPLQPPPPTQNTDEIFLTIAGVSGPSTDTAHTGSIPLVEWGWAVDQPLGSTGSGAGSPQFQVLHCLSHVSQASPRLMQLATTGADIPTVELDVRHPGATSDYYVVRLTDARISSYQVKQGESLLEEFTLAFRKVLIHVATPSANTAFTYDLQRNNAGLSEFVPQQSSLADNGFELSRQQMFLNLPGIPGGSADSAHPNQIALSSFDWGESAGRRVVFNDLHVVAPLSIASPLITQAVLTGSIIPTADLSVRVAGSRLDFYTIHLDDVRITSQQIATGPDGSEVEEFTLHFGGAPGAIAGNIFNDANHNGLQDAGETGLGGVTVFIDLHHDGTLDPLDPTAVTDSNGNFSFADLAPGTYTVRELAPGGYALTAPLGYAAAVTVGPNQTATVPAFGDTQISTLTLNFAYLLTLAQHYNRAATFATGDLNGDGTANFSDLLLLAQNYNHPLPAGTADPAASDQAISESVRRVRRSLGYTVLP